MRKVLAPLLAAAIAASVVAGFAIGGIGDTNTKKFRYSIGLWGDLPYSTVQETTGLSNLFADMNGANLAFSVHDGDLKQGSGSPCDDALYARAEGWFNSLKGAAMFTPGDNDWTDCDRASNGGYSSRERLTSGKCSSTRRTRSEPIRSSNRSRRPRIASASRERRGASRIAAGRSRA
jgi:hypothetical protein